MQVGITTSLQSDNSYMISAEKIEKNKNHSVNHEIGIDEDIWLKINYLGVGVLVENPDHSRLDAGGANL
ncbi:MULTISPECIES: hypothetical protein [Pseudoalteromonas]|nr:MULTISPECIES: hypothetical protein [Pseudoalteromonas]MBH0003567.1 hypothetical protein [Pseudoalteromonas sp. SWYJZ12]